MQTTSNTYKINCSIKILAILAVVTIITSCGFHLRGSFSLPTFLKTICITPDDPYEPLQKSLRRTLQRNQIQIVNSVSKETTNLTLTTPNYAESVLAFNANGQPQRFKLSINFQYQVSYASKVLRPFTTIQCSRDFTLTPEQLLSGDNERRLIKDELLQEAISQLLRQLSTITAPN